MRASPAIRAAFLLSGIAGLVYEVLWSRYLGLFVGHTAYAQVLVLAVYLGGVAVGSLAVADLSRRLDSPLRWYAGAEAVLALFGLVFHILFVAVTDLSYDLLFPAVGSAAGVGALRWGLAGLLILPQAMVLGTTFPLMAAGLVRGDEEHPGGSVAEAYLLNTLGGAAGVLLAGFGFIAWFGLPGTSVAAAALNLLAAGLVVGATRGERAAADEEGRRGTVAWADGTEEPGAAGARTAAAAGSGGAPSEELEGSGEGLLPVLLTVAFGTALASFAYEIGWIRMLSLVLGSATHAFEIMLSAFILGIAVGAWIIRGPSDASPRPVRLLGLVQIWMGLAALASLPLYLGTFQVMRSMVDRLAGAEWGYEIFNLGRYGLGLVVMLPSTVLAGMTLPLITGALLRARLGERTIGRVYGVNTVGSVVGVGIAGLLALPWLGLEGLIVAGALIDVALGLWLLERSARWVGLPPTRALQWALASAVAFVGVTTIVELTPETITSGVYRTGVVTSTAERRSLFYHDGRTATVSAHVNTGNGLIVLSTNGKPDASLGSRWILDRRDTLPEQPIPALRDYTTQVLAPVVTLAHYPAARTAANIGHGSGMTATALLTSDALERLVTIEIEPLMVEGSLVFLPANGPAFADPRVSYVFDDAKAYFSYRRERFDVIFAEPSNPWVSGTASLFTVEFYERVTDFMSEDGVLGQWMQIYELDDDLFLSVVAALDRTFPSYRAYLVGSADVAIVASLRSDPGAADWSVIEDESFRRLTESAPPFLGQHVESLFLFDQTTFRSILDAGVEPNSDYRPILDLGAERTRFEESFASGAYSFATSRVSLQRHLSGRPLERHPYRIPPAYGLASTVLAERGAWLRGVLESGGGIAPEEFPQWQNDLVHLEEFRQTGAADAPPPSWEAWSADFAYAEGALHWGLHGWVDSTFYEPVYEVLERHDPPAEARATVDLLHAYGTGDWNRAARAADLLVGSVGAGAQWLAPDVLLDIAVLAYLQVDRPSAAAAALTELVPHTDRQAENLRNRLLRALATNAATEG